MKGHLRVLPTYILALSSAAVADGPAPAPVPLHMGEGGGAPTYWEPQEKNHEQPPPGMEVGKM